MAGKRGASSDLNHDNWDREEVPEEAGTFQKASDDSLKQRVIKTARRRNPISSIRDSSDNEKKSAFTSFSGFGKASTPTTAAFTFLSNLNASNAPSKVNGIEEKSNTDKQEYNTTPVIPSVNQSEKSSSWTKQVESTEKSTNAAIAVDGTNNNKHPIVSSFDKSNDYFSKLKGLNQSVSTWIKKHVDSNPLINLQPIFRDYEKYFEELEKEKILKPPDVNNKTESSIGSFVFKSTTNVPDSTTEKSQLGPTTVNKTGAEQFSFGISAPSTEAPVTTKSAVSAGSFSFGTPTKEHVKTAPSFSFGTNSTIAGKSSEITTNEPVNTATPSFIFGAQPSKTAPFTFSSNTTSVPWPASVNEGTKITFGVPSSTTANEVSKPSFTFGSTSNKESTQAASTTTSSFTFGKLPLNSAIPFSSSSSLPFVNAVKPVSNVVDSKEGDEETEVPPNNEFTPVVEKDHIYTVRCKVFVKKDGKFGDRGVGSLYLKPVPDSEKVQLIVRADTNLGNVLLNFILSESIPTKRVGNKDVMLVCIPVPEVKPPPVPVLLRVKSTEEADKLLETLEKHKK